MPLLAAAEDDSALDDMVRQNQSSSREQCVSTKLEAVGDATGNGRREIPESAKLPDHKKGLAFDEIPETAKSDESSHGKMPESFLSSSEHQI